MNIKYNKIQHFLSAPDHSVRHVIEGGVVFVHRCWVTQYLIPQFAAS